MVLVFNRENCLSGTKPVRDHLARAAAAHPGSRVTVLARRLVEGAERFDLARLARVPLDGQMKKAGVTRDYNNPPFVNLFPGEPGCDDPARPLEPGEAWNAPGTRRATASGVVYGTGPDGLPVNPYTRTGLKGPGILWQCGPNHAVDNGIIALRPDENGRMTAYALCIARKYDDGTVAMAGGFMKMRKGADGAYVCDPAVALRSRAEEFFEEMISGSVTLRPEFAARLDGTLEGEKKDQQETALKMEQVRTLDPGFFKRLEDVLDGARLCYAGPVVNATRNTDTSWIETRVHWLALDEAAWDRIAGGDPAGLGYALSAGDDAAGLSWQRLDAALLGRAFDSHGAFFAYMGASFLLDAQDKGAVPGPAILEQFEDMASFLGRAAPRPDAPSPPGRGRSPR